MEGPAERLLGSPALAALADALAAGRRVVATGSAGSSTVHTAAAVARRTGRPVLLITAHLDDAEEAEAELKGLARLTIARPGRDDRNAQRAGLADAPATTSAPAAGRAPAAAAIRIPALEAAPGESGVAADLAAERFSAVRRVAALSQHDLDDAPPPVIVAPIHALMQAVPSAARMNALVRTLAVGNEHDPSELARWLEEAGYKRIDAIEEPGDFAVRGGIIDVFPIGGSVTPATGTEDPERSIAPAALPQPITAPIRLDFFGDEVETIAEVDLETLGSDRRLAAVEIIAAGAADIPREAESRSPLDAVPADTIVLLAETLEIVEQGRGYFERVTDGRGIVGPPAVLKKLGERFHALAEVNQFSAGQATADVRVELPVQNLPQFETETAAAFAELVELTGTAGAAVLVPCQTRGELDRCRELITEHAPGKAGRIVPRLLYVHRGYTWGEEDGTGDGQTAALSVVPFHELLLRYDARPRQRAIRGARAMDTFLDLQIGDYVVHQEHGIARFAGLELMPAGGKKKKRKNEEMEARARSSLKPNGNGKGRPRAPAEEQIEEFLLLEFAGQSRLYVPATQIDLVQKYVGGFSGKPPLSTIGGQKWKNQKEKVRESVRDLAGEMLRVRAAREHLPGVAYPADTAWQTEFEEEFPYQETEDQLAALQEIKRDMVRARPMDRLLCGDVGFGKTELAIRAAFKACEFGKQVAILVPTTVLAAQHERTFRQRFAAYPFRVESLSRYKTGKETNDVLAAVRKGKVDVIIGTHRLLSKDVRFADLGLVIIDEEQRFGVEHKERLLQLRTQVDVLTLSATPIPRTLHMSMLGLRDISSLTTPPLDRRAIVTEVIPYNEQRIKRAIERELSRGGQCYFVHNKVHDIHTRAEDVRRMVPDARVVVGHGQMEPKDLERVMMAFLSGDADVLVSTTIIESGIDIPTANTMFINEADRFGLADLHQLRGRVGRSKHRAYCYLLLPADRTVKEVAQKRLKAVEQYSMLGAGFKIAMRDLEIRGAGNLLGSEQSGHIAAVGYELYCRMLEREVQDLNSPGSAAPPVHTSVDLRLSGFIPRAYIPSDARRLEAYRRLAVAASEVELAKALAEIESAYGEPPAAMLRLIEIARVRIAAAAVGVRAVTVRGDDVVFLAAEPGRVEEVLAGSRGPVRTVSAELAQTNARSIAGEPLAEVYWRPPASYLDPHSIARVLAKRLTPEPATP